MSEGQKKELEIILDELANVFKGMPGQTHVTEHWSDRLPTEYLRPTEGKW